jgi:hypothetical protein
MADVHDSCAAASIQIFFPFAVIKISAPAVGDQGEKFMEVPVKDKTSRIAIF